MIELRFAKMHGAGNDFLVLEGAPPTANAASLVRWLCHRRLGIGADGVLWLQRQAPGADPLVEGHFFVHFFNADGSRFQLCVNGCRVAALRGHDLGWARGRFRLATPAGPVEAEVRQAGVALWLKPPTLVRPQPIALPAGSAAEAGWAVDTGDPHLVVELDAGAFEALDVVRQGAALRRWNGAFDGGSNVHFVRRDADLWHIRSFERGVEGETLACGSGCLAAVTALGGDAVEEVALRTTAGFRIRILPGRDRWRLEGPAASICEGTAIWEGGDASR